MPWSVSLLDLRSLALVQSTAGLMTGRLVRLFLKRNGRDHDQGIVKHGLNFVKIVYLTGHLAFELLKFIIDQLNDPFMLDLVLIAPIQLGQDGLGGRPHPCNPRIKRRQQICCRGAISPQERILFWAFQT